MVELSSALTHETPLWWTDPAGTAHEHCRLLFFVGADFLGEADFDPGDAPELDYRRSGAAYFCPHCGEVWGRVVLIAPSQERAGPHFEVHTVACERHPDQWNQPGSFLSGDRNEGYLKYLPEEALKREFWLYVKNV